MWAFVYYCCGQLSSVHNLVGIIGRVLSGSNSILPVAATYQSSSLASLIALMALLSTDFMLKLLPIPINLIIFSTLAVSESNGREWNNREISRQLGSPILMDSSCYLLDNYPADILNKRLVSIILFSFYLLSLITFDSGQITILPNHTDLGNRLFFSIILIVGCMLIQDKSTYCLMPFLPVSLLGYFYVISQDE